MKKILIKSCKECPYQQVWMNRECQKIITDVNAISPNCPLADDLPESKLNKQELWNKITCNGMREMTEERFYQALKELPESKGSETEIAKNRMLYFEFDEVKPKVGDRIVKAYLEGDDKLGSIRTIIKDDDNYHMVCGDGSTYNKCAEHGWRRLIEVGYCNNSQQAKSDGWIPVSERLPEEGRYFIGLHALGVDPYIADCNGMFYTPHGTEVTDMITHWQPLPAVPQKKGEK
jgi:hypothetical protein